MQSLKKSFASTKVGETGFKVLNDGSYFNANSTINETFKMFEDALNSSGVNELFGKDSLVFSIGINCDADSSYNKDPKDPGKYEQEG